MTLMSRCRTVAVAALAVGMSVAMPAGAGVLLTEASSRMPGLEAGLGGRGPAEAMMPRLLGDAALPAGAAALRAAASQGGMLCDGCAPNLVAAEAPRGSATLSVNMAILVLGSLWLTLMVRRIQLRIGGDGLNGGGRPHAAGGH
jgi:hypothetical protein